MSKASAHLYAGTGADLTRKKRLRWQTDIFQCTVVCPCCWNGHSQWSADMQLHQVKGHRSRASNSTRAKILPDNVCFMARFEASLEETVVFVMVIDARFLFLVECCDTHSVSWTDQADKVRSRCGQENRAVLFTFTVSSGSDRVKRGDESKLQRYRVADRERETSWFGSRMH